MKSSKPKILYIITKSNWGGAQKYVYDLATSDINMRFDVEVMTGAAGEMAEKLEEAGIKTYTYKKLSNTLNPIKIIGIVIYLRKFLHKSNPDIVHINSSVAGLAGSVACKLAKKKYVFTAHGWPFNENRNILVRFILRLCMMLVVKMSYRTIAVSQNIIESLTKIKSIRNKMQVIYNGIKKTEFKILPKLSSGSKNKVLHIVSVGELHPSKNHISVIRILNYIKDIHYHIIGTGKLEEKIKKEIEKNKLEKRVTMHGHIKSANLILPQFDMFILPSRTEALGYVVLEALQAGLPVVARSVGGVPEIIKDLDYAKLYTHDNQLISILSEWRPEVKKWADKRFEYENMITETKNLYLSML